MPIVTLSRGFPAGCHAVAEAVAASLGCPCTGREILVEAAAKLGVSADLLGSRIEQTPNLWSRLTAQRHGYIVAVQAALAEHALSGDLVYDSYAGHLLLQDLPCVLRVRIVAPLETRIREAMQSENLTRHVAEASVSRYDEVRGRWTKTLYGVDWSDPSLYDLVLNLEQLSADEASDCIVRIARHPRFAIGEDFRGRLQDFVLVTRTRLAIERSPKTRGLAMEVTARNGEVVVSVVASEASMPGALPEVFRREVMSVLAAVEGVERVELNIEPRGLFP
jgi:cytidylate kinase